MTTVQDLPVLVLVVKCTISRAHLACVHVHGIAIGGVLLDIGIWIRIFAGKEPLLSSTFSVINHSLVGAWAFTLCKVNNVLIETVWLIWLSIGNRLVDTSTDLLVNLVLLLLLLICKRLFKLELLLQLLLLVGQYWMLALCLWLSTGLIDDLFLGILGWCHHGSHKCIRSVHHHCALLGLYRRHVHWVSHCSGVASTYKLTTFLLLQSICSLHNFILVTRVLSGVIHRRIVAGLNNWIWHTFMLILIGIYIQWLPIRLTRSMLRNQPSSIFNIVVTILLNRGLLGFTVVMRKGWLTWQVAWVRDSCHICACTWCQLWLSKLVVGLWWVWTISIDLLTETLFNLLLLGSSHVPKVVWTLCFLLCSLRLLLNIWLWFLIYIYCFLLSLLL